MQGEHQNQVTQSSVELLCMIAQSQHLHRTCLCHPSAPREYPPHFGLRLVKLLPHLIKSRSMPPAVPPSLAEMDTQAFFDGLSWESDLWEDAKLVEVLQYLRGNKSLIIGQWRPSFPTALWSVKHLIQCIFLLFTLAEWFFHHCGNMATTNLRWNSISLRGDCSTPGPSRAGNRPGSWKRTFFTWALLGDVGIEQDIQSQLGLVNGFFLFFVEYQTFLAVWVITY